MPAILSSDPKPIRSSELRSLIGFYQRQTISDNYGNEQTVFPDVPVFTCAANIKPRLGGESVLAARLSGSNMVNITVRKSSDTAQIDSAWRVKDERTNVIYNVRSVIDPYEQTCEHDRFIEMLCEKGVA
jgi:SPP1 family predicted phage head-tail adaptor